MFLLSRKVLLQYKTEGLLDIEGFDSQYLLPAHYEFRLGRSVQLWNGKVRDYTVKALGDPGREILDIPPGGYAIIMSLERFKLSKRVLGIFGQISTLVQRGLRLNHSPTIDPTFSGYLEMGVENLLNKPTEMRYGDAIGKVLFFDISDTYPIPSIKGTRGENNFRRRDRLDIPEPLE